MKDPWSLARRHCFQVCWAVAEEQRCAAEEAASSPTSKREEVQAYAGLLLGAFEVSKFETSGR